MIEVVIEGLQERLRAVLVRFEAVFEICPHRLNLVQIGRIGGQKKDPAPSALNELDGSLRFMKTGIIQHHDHTWTQNRHKTALNPLIENGRIRVSLEPKRRLEPAWDIASYQGRS